MFNYATVISTLRQCFNVRIRQGEVVLRLLDSDYHLSHQSYWQLAIKGPYTGYSQNYWEKIMVYMACSFQPI